MDQFSTVLRDQVVETDQLLAKARQAGHDYEVHLHGARISDLLDVAARHGIDTSGWVDRAVLDDAMLAS